jgi:Lipoprotein LpqB beta-propeller domain/Sporulation and spore germination
MPELRQRPARLDPPAHEERPARPHRPGRAAARVLIAALVTAFLAAGCAAVPTSGLLQTTNLPSGNGSVQQRSDCCGLIMSPPATGWGPATIVLNFILASADFRDHHAIARQYLTPAASKAWRPGPGPAVTVIAKQPTITFTRRPSSAPDSADVQNSAAVQISVQMLGRVTASGQYVPASGGQSELQQEFGLQQVHHRWRIANLPSGNVSQPSTEVSQSSNELLLTKDLFQLAYQPRNLYYLAPTGKQQLVPDPVFVPVDTADPANDLVRALLPSPQGWLAPGVLSAFPPAARPTRPVSVPPGSKTAIVELSMPRSAVTDANLSQMSAQLVWTLTSTSYGSTPIQAVKLVVNGRAWTPPGASSAVQSQRTYPQPALQSLGPKSLYFLSTEGAARKLTGPGTSSAALPGEAGTGQIRLTSIAVSPDGHYLAALAGPPSAATLYTEDMAAAAKPHANAAARALHTRLSGVQLTSVSWDHHDNLWVAGAVGHRVKVWVVPGSGGAPKHVGLPAHTGPITALRVAPDGVRLALITRLASGPQVRLTAIVKTNEQYTLSSAVQIGADLLAPSALSWYDADHLVVVNQATADPQLEEVPVDGDRSSYQGIQPDMASIAAAGPKNPLFATLQTGNLTRSVGLGELWTQVLAGRAATYPG